MTGREAGGIKTLLLLKRYGIFSNGLLAIKFGNSNQNISIKR
jgi:hypothetical protein